MAYIATNPSGASTGRSALTLLAEPSSFGFCGPHGCGYGDRMSDMAYSGPGARRPRPLLRTLVGEALRRNRLEQGRTLADVARDACVSIQYLSEVERGRKEPSSEVLAAVCASLRIELSDLLHEVGRDLANDRAPIVRLQPAPQRRNVAPPTAGFVLRLYAAERDLDPVLELDAAPPTAAAEREPGNDRAPVLRLAAARRHDVAAPARRPGDVVLLAA